MSMIGTRVVRREDPELLTVGGSYVDDLAPADALHATFVRSVMAHADLTGVDTAEAAAMPGVVAVLTAADLGLELKPPAMPMFNQAMTRSWLAIDRVRYVGELVAVVLSETREAGVDAAEAVVIDYEPLDVVATTEQALADETVLFPEAGTNTVTGFPPGDEDVLTDGEVVVELSFRNHRLTAAPIEPRAALARWEDDPVEEGGGGEPRLTQWSSTQFPHTTRDNLAGAIGVDADRIRVITPDVGGGFGAKNGAYPEDIVVALAARHLGRPVRWCETRSENMVGMVHGRAQEYRAALAGTSDGTITGYQLHVIQDAGGYPAIGAVLPMLTRMMASGVYDIPKVAFSSTSVVTNTAPVGAYRGAGRPEATHAIERMIDLFATEIGMDPAEVRRRNFLAPEAFPLTTPTGAAMDTGEYAKALDMVIDAADYAGLRAEQEARRSDPSRPLLGLGWSTYVEITNPMSSNEYGSIQVRPDGSALILTGSSAHGQGHHTTFAQLASGVTGIPIDRIEVRHGDTDEVPRGGGTGGSRSLQLGGSAVTQASDAVVDEARQIAAELLEANPDDVRLDPTTGSFSVVGTPAVSTSWSEVASRHHEQSGNDLKAEVDFEPEGATFPFGAHLSIVEVDRDTGAVTPVRHVACDDAGVLVNPMIVDGQVHGGTASGIAHVLMEEFAYDADGNPQTANFMDYGIASAAELPSFERIPMETPTPRNPLGAKGIGESGSIGAAPAVHNAVVDAVAHLGVRHVEMPTTPQRVWQAMNART
ncbi:MAG: xanthine dehydrogenase family protein molybdopterin-binding subunit [Actinomycetota bacterium]